MIKEFLFLAQWASWRSHSSHWLPTEERHKHTRTHHTATALRQLLSAVPHLHVCVASLLPPPTPTIEQSVATGGCRPNKRRQPRNTPPFVLHDVTVPRICLLFLLSVNVGEYDLMCALIDRMCQTVCSGYRLPVFKSSKFIHFENKTDWCLWKYKNLLHYNVLYVGLVAFVIYPS